MSDLTPDILLRAYAVGLFPMAESRGDRELFWVDPEWRGIIPLDAFHLPRRLRRTLRHNPFTVSADRAFERVIRACAEPSAQRRDSWINDEIIALYTALHAMGRAHSVECWQGETLAGGLYGVSLCGVFFGESMFTRVTDASKVALAHLVARLRLGGYRLLDAQFLTHHLKRFGAIEVSRAQYRAMLAEALDTQARFYLDLGDSEVLDALDVRHPSTHTS